MLSNINRSNNAYLEINRSCTFSQNCPLSCICGTLQKTDPSCITKIHFEKDVSLFRNEIDYGCVYVIISGISMVYNLLDNGELMVLGLAGRGDTIGETEAFIENRILYWVKTLTPTVFCRLSLAYLSDFIEKEPVKMINIFKASGNNMVMISRQIWVMNAQRIYDRLKRLLFVIAILQRKNGKDEIQFTISHEDLALLINANRVTITRLLSVLKREGFVTLGYNDIHITDQIFENRVINGSYPLNFEEVQSLL